MTKNVAIAAAVLLTSTWSAWAQPAQPAAAAQQIVLTAGRSTVLTTEFDVNRIAITNPAIADATVVQPREVLIDGKATGTVSLIVWGPNVRTQYDVVVAPAVTSLQQELQRLFPGENIQVNVSEDAVIISGRVSSNPIKLRVGEVAAATVAKAKIVNMLQLPAATDSDQVLLQVRFAEVNRRAITELGASGFTSGLGFHNNIARTTTQQFAAPSFDNDKVTFSDFLNLFLFNTKYDLGIVIRALKQKGFFQSLAEPNLVAYNGEEASFLAGGEIPIPVVQGATGNVSIQWKEYGIRLNFKPTIAGDTIRLKVRPEVSSLDFPNGVSLGGFRVPALTTRRAETDVELRDGQSFAIAGLLDNVSQDNDSKIPGLGDLPIIGYLFKSKAVRAERTELMVLVTPRLVRPLNPDEVPPLPTMPRQFLPPDEGAGGAIEGGGTVDAPPVKK